MVEDMSNLGNVQLGDDVERERKSDNPKTWSITLLILVDVYLNVHTFEGICAESVDNAQLIVYNIVAFSKMLS